MCTVRRLLRANSDLGLPPLRQPPTTQQDRPLKKVAATGRKRSCSRGAASILLPPYAWIVSHSPPHSSSERLTRPLSRCLMTAGAICVPCLPTECCVLCLHAAASASSCLRPSWARNKYRHSTSQFAKTRAAFLLHDASQPHSCCQGGVTSNCTHTSVSSASQDGGG